MNEKLKDTIENFTAQAINNARIRGVRSKWTFEFEGMEYSVEAAPVPVEK